MENQDILDVLVQQRNAALDAAAALSAENRALKRRLAELEKERADEPV